MNENKLNQWLNRRRQRKEELSADRLFEAICKGDRNALAQGITLIESSLDTDKALASELIQKCLPKIGNSIRIGITGVPGVGKSSFIEAFGMLLISEGKKVAVLAIDPSSEKTHGSILGDKTRMEHLSSNESAFIRPSPAGSSLGGVARKTRESSYLCEAAGYDFIIIETVGVGQSETSVHSMVDFFLLLMLSGAGDELQGIKRGIMEMADLLVVTKADGDNQHAAKKARQSYQNAMHLFPPNDNNWTPKALTASIYEPESLTDIYRKIEEFVHHTKSNTSFEHKRKEQDRYWLEETLRALILDSFYEQASFKKELHKLKQEVSDGKMSSFQAAYSLFNKYRHGKD